MAELATGAGVAGLISFSVLLFRGCVKAIQLISDARHAGEHVDRASCLLEYEEYRLLQWGDRVGLSDANPENQRLNWELIRKLLKQLHDLLTDANSLKVRYGLEALDAPSSGSKQPIPAKDSNKKGNRAFRSFWTDVSPAIKATRMTALEQDLGAFKKLIWVSLDQQKIHGLLADIAHYNNCLRALLDSAEQTFVRRGLSALLRDAVSRTTNNTDVSLLQMLLDDEAVLEAAEINAAASLKQSRLKLGFDKRADEMTMNKTAQMTPAQTNATTATRSKISQLNYRSLTRSTNATTMLDREIATYRGGKWDMHSSVLLEWKYVKKSDDEVLGKRIKSLAYLMGQLDGASFHSLRSLGYLKHELANDCYLYAYVFELTDLTKSQEVVEPALRPLSVLFTASRSPSLSERLYIAVTIAETVLQLHTAGWLHKRISAKNVLFVDNGPLTWECSTSRGPFLAGYDFSRNVHATTEEMQDNAEAALRQHPLVGKGPFRKVYDLYALGCLMLELLFWQSLEDILCISVENRPEPVLSTASEDVLLEEHQSRDAKILRGKELLLDHNNFSSFILDAVAHKSGDVWRDIVNLCFFPEETESTDGRGGELEDILETSVRTQIRIVDLLRSINV